MELRLLFVGKSETNGLEFMRYNSAIIRKQATVMKDSEGGYGYDMVKWEKSVKGNDRKRNRKEWNGRKRMMKTKKLFSMILTAAVLCLMFSAWILSFIVLKPE